ncbi:hypothetical protein K1J48_03180 [Enterobacter hormaechei]|uniref:hypothetical protein n=1 Tax=Enterobacter hormaechei TaxID=158836 RepID=UPI001C640A74|nr:hypothetical protein [Enterobacter hormaechei]MBW7781754.1 hypothetical protein [Enterobacter hormaechei]
MANDIKIPFQYCNIERASRLLGCEISDLINLGVTKKISLCLNLFDARAVLYMRTDSKSACDWFDTRKANSTTSMMGNNITEFSRLHLYRCDYNEETEETIHVPLFGQETENGCFSSIGKAYGLWRLWSGLEELQNFGEYALSGFELTPCHPETDNPAVQLLMVGEDSDYDEEDDQVFKNKISINDLWITAQDIRRLLDCGGDYFMLTDDIEFVEPHKMNGNEIVHHSAERHARNREQILMVAMRFKEEQQNAFNESCRKTDGTINYSAWARELIARPDWFINGELPIKTETKIAAILNNAHKRPSERTQ